MGFCVPRDGAAGRPKVSPKFANSTLPSERFMAFAMSCVSKRAGRADHGAGDDHGGVVEHEAFEADREAGERVVQRDHHRHVGAADGQGHGDAQQQRAGEEQRDGRAGPSRSPRRS